LGRNAGNGEEATLISAVRTLAESADARRNFDIVLDWHIEIDLVLAIESSVDLSHECLALWTDNDIPRH